jgi:hypothetical protein
MKYAIQMASGGMIYIPAFMKVDRVMQKLLGGTHIKTHTYRIQGNLISLLLFFQNRESRLKWG